MRKKIKTALTIAALAVLTACGGGGDDDDKSVFSLWTRDDGVRIDLTGGAFSTPFGLALFRPSGAQCNCTITVVGREDAGNVVINQCYYVVGSAATPPEPACSVSNGTGSYTKSGNVLTLTGPAGTANFR